MAPGDAHLVVVAGEDAAGESLFCGILSLDEPELGLSDGYAGPLGSCAGQQSLVVPAACAGVVVVTHSRRLFRGLLDGYGHRPTFVHVGDVGDGPAALDARFAEPETWSVEELLTLPEIAHER